MLCVCLHAEIFTLGVVEVTAKDEGVSTPNVSVVNKKTIQLNNAKTVSDIAKLTPGVSLRGGAYARNETSISIRGLSSTQIPVYIDGIGRSGIKRVFIFYPIPILTTGMSSQKRIMTGLKTRFII